MSGRDITPFQGSGTTAAGLAIDPTDGKIVVVGTDVLNPNGQISSIALARYNTDGTLDTTFGTDGQVSTGFNSELAKAYAVVVTSTGQILVAGSIAEAGSPASSDFLLARWNSDGSLDTTFGTNGSTITDFAGGQDIGRALAIFGSRIYVAGQASNSTGKHFGIAAYSLSGFPDPSFGNTGTIITTVQGNFEQATAIAIDPNTGNIVVAGRAGNSSGPFSFGLVRYNPNGTHDNTFGVHGKVTDPFGPNGAKAFAVAIKSGGGIIAAGQANTDSSGDADFALAKFSNAGTLAAGFGNAGQVITDADNNPADVDQIAQWPWTATAESTSSEPANPSAEPGKPKSIWPVTPAGAFWIHHSAPGAWPMGLSAGPTDRSTPSQFKTTAIFSPPAGRTIPAGWGWRSKWRDIWATPRR